MDFKIKFPIEPSEKQLAIDDSIFLTGSCFSEHIGSFLLDYRFNVYCNPNGTVYNPISIFGSVKAFLKKEDHPESDLFEHAGSWYSIQCHSKWSADTKESLQVKLSGVYRNSAERISNSAFIFITLGTAYVYELKETDQIVANCHRLPATNFNKRLLSVDEIVDAFSETCIALKGMKPRPKVVLTVSPVKHLRDGVHENNLSKSTLLLAVQKIRERYPAVDYFPAFEIVNDELRDYRFYEQDFAHPNKLAIDYVTERFKEVFMSERASSFVSDYAEIRSAMQHRVMQHSSNSHRNFLRTFYQRTMTMQAKYPELEFAKELNYFNPDNLQPAKG